MKFAKHLALTLLSVSTGSLLLGTANGQSSAKKTAVDTKPYISPQLQSVVPCINDLSQVTRIDWLTEKKTHEPKGNEPFGYGPISQNLDFCCGKIVPWFRSSQDSNKVNGEGLLKSQIAEIYKLMEICNEKFEYLKDSEKLKEILKSIDKMAPTNPVKSSGAPVIQSSSPRQ